VIGSANPEPVRKTLKSLVSSAAWLLGVAAVVFCQGALAAPSILDAVLEHGVLKVCTSGDYRPFSYSADGVSFEGNDIDMAGSLAQSLGAKIEWVQTPWKVLTDNVAQRRCDIAMGGISLTLERQRFAAFTQPYLADGKTAITRCELAARFDSFEAIDQPGVRAVVNPGGTNQKFAQSHLKNATLATFPDNATIFDEIAANRADVMITDASEVRQQVKRHAGVLCQVSAKEPFLFGEKAYLVPRDDAVWLDYVNQWLRIQSANGVLTSTLKHWVY
jgi:cyclohexadienyl dehydratase